MVLNGSIFLIFIDTVTPKTAERGNPTYYRPIICGKTNGFNMDFDTIAFDNKCDGGWRNSASGYGSWGLSLEGHAVGVKSSEKALKASFNEVANLAKNKTIFWAMMADIDRSIVREGLMRIGSYTETANMDEPYSFNLSLVGIGEPILEVDLFDTVIGVNQQHTELLQDGNNNLISINDGD